MPASNIPSYSTKPAECRTARTQHVTTPVTATALGPLRVERLIAGNSSDESPDTYEAWKQGGKKPGERYRAPSLWEINTDENQSDEESPARQKADGAR